MLKKYNHIIKCINNPTLFDYNLKTIGDKKTTPGQKSKKWPELCYIRIFDPMLILQQQIL